MVYALEQDCQFVFCLLNKVTEFFNVTGSAGVDKVSNRAG